MCDIEVKGSSLSITVNYTAKKKEKEKTPKMPAAPFTSLPRGVCVCVYFTPPQFSALARAAPGQL